MRRFSASNVSIEYVNRFCEWLSKQNDDDIRMTSLSGVAVNILPSQFVKRLEQCRYENSNHWALDFRIDASDDIIAEMVLKFGGPTVKITGDHED